MHAGAFGISILDENLDKFKEYINNNLKRSDFSSSYRVDFIWSANQAEQYKNDIIDLGKLEDYWGKGLSEPYVAIENIQIHKDNIILMSPNKKPTLKIILPGNLTLIKFNSSQKEYDNLFFGGSGATIINAVGVCKLNEWNGDINPQIIIEEYEVVNKLSYYF